MNTELNISEEVIDLMGQAPSSELIGNHLLKKFPAFY
jgi:hypothetical protein